MGSFPEPKLMPNFSREVQHVYFAKFMPTVSHNGNPIIRMIYRAKIHTENLNNYYLSQNVDMTKHE